MSEELTPTATVLSADELADKQIMRQLTVCILTMMVIAAAIITTANIVA